MRVRLTRKLAQEIDGIDLSGHAVGDVIDLPASDANLLMAEEWAFLERRTHRSAAGATPQRRRDDIAHDRRPKRGTRAES